jgi:PAS domain S-box-containing protein
MNFMPETVHDEGRAEKLDRNPSPDRQAYALTAAKESVGQTADDADDMFTYAPVSLWEEDFSELRKRFDYLKRSGVEDLRKHFKQHPEEVLSLARMVRIVRINKETLSLYEATGPIEFREGLRPIFNKDSFDVFKEELVAFWKGKNSFTMEAVNLTFAGTKKNILLHAIIPPGFEQSWARVYIAITDITAIKDNTRNLAASEQKYRGVFNEVQTSVLLVDVQSGVIIEANKSAKRLLGASNGELAGRHLADVVHGEEQDRVRALLDLQPDQPGFPGQIMHVRSKNNSTIPVFGTAKAIEDGSNVIILTLSPADERMPARPAERKIRGPHAALGKKLTQREREILRLICSGKTSKVIAHCLTISNKTVETHRSRIMQKLNMHCVVDLVKFAMSNGLARMQ